MGAKSVKTISLVTVKLVEGNFLSDPGIFGFTLRTAHETVSPKCRQRSPWSVQSPYRSGTEITAWKAQPVCRVHGSQSTEEPI